LLLTTPLARRADQRYLVCGYYPNTYFGGGEFYWDPDSIEADNGGTVLAIPDVAIGRFKRVIDGTCRPEMFGATPDADLAPVIMRMVESLGDNVTIDLSGRPYWTIETRCDIENIQNVSIIGPSRVLIKNRDISAFYGES